MKYLKFLRTYVCLLLGFAAFTACTSDEEEALIPEGKGYVKLSLNADAGFQTKAVNESDYTKLDNYTVQIWQDGKIVPGCEWKYSEMPAFTELQNGTYTLSAFIGDSTKATYIDDLCFLGSESFVLKNDSAQVSVDCKPNSARINVVFGEEMEKYFSSYEVKITTVAQSKTGTPFTWDKDTTGPVYFKVNKNETVNFVVKLTKTDGTKVEDKTYSYSLSPGNAKKITLTPNVTSGSFELTIKIDETVIDHIVDIEVPSDWV